jgi:hypothetical protein
MTAFAARIVYSLDNGSLARCPKLLVISYRKHLQLLFATYSQPNV